MQGSDDARPRGGLAITIGLLLVMAGVVASIFFLAQSRSEATPPTGDAIVAAAVPPTKAAAPAERLASAASEGRKVHIGVFGDSFSDGIWWALDQQLRDLQNVEVHRFGRPGTGLTNYTRINLFDDLRGKAEAQPLDIAIISFGANDTQPLHGAESPTPFMTDRWQQVVGDRMDALVGLLRQRGVAVYWVGLPRMRSDGYDAKVQQLNGFIAARMQHLGVTFLDSVAVTGNSAAGGAYLADLTDPQTGRTAPARTADGIHMTMSGYTTLMRPLAGRLRAQIGQARAQRPGSPG
jgi:hypothetical protein